MSMEIIEIAYNKEKRQVNDLHKAYNTLCQHGDIFLVSITDWIFKIPTKELKPGFIVRPTTNAIGEFREIVKTYALTKDSLEYIPYRGNYRNYTYVQVKTPKKTKQEQSYNTHLYHVNLHWFFYPRYCWIPDDDYFKYFISYFKDNSVVVIETTKESKDVFRCIKRLQFQEIQRSILSNKKIKIRLKMPFWKNTAMSSDYRRMLHDQQADTIKPVPTKVKVSSKQYHLLEQGHSQIRTTVEVSENIQARKKYGGGSIRQYRKNF